MAEHQRFKFKSITAAVMAALTAPVGALAQSAPGDQALPEIKVQGQAERSDGPVDGYRATRSGTFTKTDAPLKEVPASVTVVPAQLMKDQAMQSMGDVFRYVPGVLMHQGEGNRDQAVIRGNSTSATVSTSNPYAIATSFRPNTTDANNKVSADIAALYAQDQIALSKEWKLLAGLRYDYFKVNFEDRRTLVPAANLARTDIGVSPRAGLIWAPNAISTYYVSYSYAFLPSAEQLGLATTNAALAPETAMNYEIGGRWDVLPKLTLSTSVFRLERNNVKVIDPATPGVFVNTGQQRTQGVELGAQGDVMRNWQVYGGYTYMDARVAKPFNSNTTATTASLVPAGNKVGLVPEHTLSVWNKFNLGNGWGTGLGIIYQGASYTSFLNTVKLPAFARADGALFYAFSGGKTRLALNVENIFNKKYWPTVDGDNNISVGAPDNARLTLSTVF